jgi:thiamine-phosphate pyrophosphorylase
MAETAFAVPRLIVFSDTTRVEPAPMLMRFAELARRARAGSVLFTLRDYALSARSRWRLADKMAALASEHAQSFGIADRADLARALGCRAFHLPESGLSALDARRYLGASVFLSRGYHESVVAAEPELDARLLSPIFESRKGRPALGLASLAQAACVRSSRSAALFALGAVDALNAGSCLATGAAGVAVIGAALAADAGPLLSALEILRG